MNLGELGRYILGGLAGLILNLALTIFMREGLDLSVEVSFAIALTVVFCFHFMTNAFFVYRSGADVHKFGRYVASALVFRFHDFLLFTILIYYTSMHYTLAVASALLVTNAVKFWFYAKFVFVKLDDPADR